MGRIQSIVAVLALLLTSIVTADDVPGMNIIARLFRLAGEDTVNHVKLSWQLSADSFVVSRSIGHGVFKTIAKTVGYNYDDYDLNVGPTYYYKVEAYNGTDIVAFSQGTAVKPYKPSGNYQTYDNTFIYSSLNVSSILESGGVFYQYIYETDANGFLRLVQQTSADGYSFSGDFAVLTRGVVCASTNGYCKLERISIRKHPSGKFVLWAHFENQLNYNLGQLAVAEGSPGDAFDFIGTFRPLGYDSRDCDFFADTDGTAYIVSANATNTNLNLYKLYSNWTAVESLVATLLPGRHREAPALVKVDDYYYLFTSEAAGWFPSSGEYISAASMDGPWSNSAKIGNIITFGTQSGGVKQLGQHYFMMADGWGRQLGVDPVNYSKMLPLSFNNGTASYEQYTIVQYNTDRADLVPVQSGRILSIGKPVRTSGVSLDTPQDAALYPDENANDGNQIESTNYFKPYTVPFFLEIDLEQGAIVSQVDLLTKTVKGSETYYQFYIRGSADRKNYVLLADQSANKHVSFVTAVIRNAGVYRYIRLEVTSVINANNGNSASWARGVNELTVYGTITGTNTGDTVEAPVADVVSNVYDSPVTVTLSTNTTGASIYYTKDGSIPSKANGIKYSGPINISQSMDLTAIAIKTGYVDSNITAYDYVIV